MGQTEHDAGADGIGYVAPTFDELERAEAALGPGRPTYTPRPPLVHHERRYLAELREARRRRAAGLPTSLFPCKRPPFPDATGDHCRSCGGRIERVHRDKGSYWRHLLVSDSEVDQP